jgi:hypothetical protein
LRLRQGSWHRTGVGGKFRSVLDLRFLARSVVVSLMFVELACTPKDRTMSVAFSRTALYDLKSDTWDYGRAQECQIFSSSTQRADQDGDLLICGADTLLAWGNLWLRPDLKSKIYDISRPFAVSFQSGGHSSRARTWWVCTRTARGIECD